MFCFANRHKSLGFFFFVFFPFLSTSHFYPYSNSDQLHTWHILGPPSQDGPRNFSSSWRHQVSRDSVLKGQTLHINYDRTRGPIGLKLGMYLSREVLYRKIGVTSSWRPHMTFYVLLKFWVIKVLLTISGELNTISGNFFLINIHYAM